MPYPTQTKKKKYKADTTGEILEWEEVRAATSNRTQSFTGALSHFSKPTEIDEAPRSQQ